MDKYVLEASQFNPGQILTFRVQAVNSLFNGEFSDEYKFSIEHSVIEDTIENIQVVSKSDSKVNIKWSKVIPKENSALNNGSTWFYRYIYLLLFAQCLLFNCLKYIYIYFFKVICLIRFLKNQGLMKADFRKHLSISLCWYINTKFKT